MVKKEAAKRWLDFAETDLNSAEILFSSRSGKADKRRFRLVIWLCHQSIEKILKGIITMQDKFIVPIHDIVKLSQDAGVSLTNEQTEFIDKLNAYYIPPRYPDLRYNKPLPRFTQEAAARYLTETKELFKCLKKFITQKK